MSHYVPNLRDLQFNLFEWLGRDRVLGEDPYVEIDADTANEMLSEVTRLAVEDLAPSLLTSDRNPPVFDPVSRTASLPDDFKHSYKAYLDGEWWRTDIPVELGGTAIPPSLRWAIAELVLGSNPAVHLFASGHAFAKLVYVLGTPDQKQLAKHMVDHHWGSTMVLTEPDAGSDVGAGRAKAVRQPDGSWHLSGVKRFITSGEADIFDNIVHLVLARPEGHGPGTKGLSLFVVPKYHVDLETGTLGEHNGVFATAVEHKMGLKVSTTCELRFGEVNDVPAVGTLLGNVHDGIAQMFHIIETARMMVGTKAIATLSTGYLNALDFAKTRIQGPDLTRQADRTAPRVTILHHPDIRRSLMTQKAYVEGLRALVLYTASQQDAIAVAQARGETAETAERLNDLLLPLVKGVGSERSWVLLGTESLQTFGGSGFLQDYPLEQYIRDAKIDTLYEGTTAIQGMDFFFRKVVKDRGQALSHLARQIDEFAKAGNSDGRLAAERELLGKALEDVQGIVAYLVGQLMAANPRTEGGKITNVYKVGQNTTRFLLAAGDLLIGWLLLWQAELAQAKLDSVGTSGSGALRPADEAFYQGKVAAARFFARQVLPRLAVERQITEATSNDLMDLPEEAF